MFKLLLRTLFGLVLLTLIVSLLIAIRSLPNFQEVRQNYVAEGKLFVDRHGEVIDQISIEKSSELKKTSISHKQRRLNWITLKQIRPGFAKIWRDSQRQWPLEQNFALLNRLEDRTKLSYQSHQFFSKFFRAVALSMAWSTDQRLEAALNLFSYQSGTQGLSLASRSIFEKPPSRLNEKELRLLSELAHSSGESSLQPVLMERPIEHLAPVVVEHFKETRPNEDKSLVQTTLDQNIQWDVLFALTQTPKSGSAAIVLDNVTGNVLAYVSALSAAVEVRNRSALGRALWPFLYLRSLDEHVMTSTSRLSPGVDLKAAMSRRGDFSLAALTTLERLGTESLITTLKHLGFSDLEPSAMYGPSIATGNLQVSLLELTNAYRTLSNGGLWSPVRFLTRELSDQSRHRVFSEASVFILRDLLKQKSIASESYHIGFRDRFTVGVRGTNTQLQDILERLAKYSVSPPQRPVDSTPRPPDLVQAGGDWYLKGTEPNGNHRVPTWISYPKRGEVIASRHTPMFIQIAQPQIGQNVYLDGQRLGPARSRLPWRPESGHFRLELRDFSGRLLHRVEFDVRGRRFAKL